MLQPCEIVEEFYYATGDEEGDGDDEGVGCDATGSPQAWLHNLLSIDELIRDRESHRLLRETLTDHIWAEVGDAT